MTDPIGVGIVGLGNSGWFYHAEDCIEPSPLFELVGVAGSGPARLQAASERFRTHAHPETRSLLADPRVELVVVTAPSHLHHDIARDALAAGKHVLVDKPLTLTAPAATQLGSLAGKSGTVLTVFQNRRWEPSFVRIRQIVASGEIGDVWRVEESRIHAGPYRVASPTAPHVGDEVAAWTTDVALGGGMTYLVAPHLVDHQLVLFGRAPRTVSARMHTFAGERAEHHADLQLDFGDGVVARIEVLRDPVVDLPRWIVYGTRGTIVVPVFTRLELKRDGRPVHVEDGLATVRGCVQFYDQLWSAIRDGAPVPVSMDDAVDAVRVMELAHRSASSGGRVLEFRGEHAAG